MSSDVLWNRKSIFLIFPLYAQNVLRRQTGTASELQYGKRVHLIPLIPIPLSYFTQWGFVSLHFHYHLFVLFKGTQTSSVSADIIYGFARWLWGTFVKKTISPNTILWFSFAGGASYKEHILKGGKKASKWMLNQKCNPWMQLYFYYVSAEIYCNRCCKERGLFGWSV